MKLIGMPEAPKKPKETQDLKCGYTRTPMFPESPWYPGGDNSDVAANHQNRIYRKERDENTR